MKDEYYGYLTPEHEDGLMDRLEVTEVYDDDANAPEILMFPVASWRSPLELDCAMEYQMACLTYALIRTIGSNAEEFEQIITEPHFSVARRITYEVDDTSRALKSIHFLKCVCADEHALSPQSKIEIFKILLSLLGTVGISGEEAVRIFKEELRIS
jgi:hypothetical protein